MVEPEPTDADNSIGGLVSDERVELADAQRWLAGAAQFGFSGRTRLDYRSQAIYRDFEAWADALVSVEPARAGLLDELRPTVRKQFYALTEPHPAGHVVERVNHLVFLRAA